MFCIQIGSVSFVDGVPLVSVQDVPHNTTGPTHIFSKDEELVVVTKQVCVSVSVFTTACFHIGVSVSLSDCMSVCLSVVMSCLDVCDPVYIHVCKPLFMSVCLSSCLDVCDPVYLHVSEALFVSVYL